MVPGRHRRADQQATSSRTAPASSVADFPKTFDGICRRSARRIKDKTGTLCDIRLTVNDLLAQMVYEGDVDVINDDGNDASRSTRPTAVAWLQMYVDMVKAGTVDNTALTTKDDRVGLLLFSAGQAPFYQTGPNLIREVKSNNADALRATSRRAGPGRQVGRHRARA